MDILKALRPNGKKPRPENRGLSSSLSELNAYSIGSASLHHSIIRQQALFTTRQKPRNIK